jgi:hypothetical protein
MIDDGALREAAVNWFSLTSIEVRRLAFECLALRKLARAAEAIFLADNEPEKEQDERFRILHEAVDAYRASVKEQA